MLDGELNGIITLNVRDKMFVVGGVFCFCHLVSGGYIRHTELVRVEKECENLCKRLPGADGYFFRSTAPQKVDPPLGSVPPMIDNEMISITTRVRCGSV